MKNHFRTTWPYYLAAFTCALFLVVLLNVRLDGRVFAFDQQIFQTLQSARTPQLDTLLITITQLGDSFMVTALVIVTAIWLLVKRVWRTAIYWSVTILAAAVLNSVVKSAIVRVRPGDMMYSGFTAYSFPSGHTTANLVLYGFLCIVLYPILNKPARTLLVICTGGFVATVAFSRLYLGAHWFSDVLGGLLLGTSILCIMGSRYHARDMQQMRASYLLVPVIGTLLLAGSVHTVYYRDLNLQRYTPQSKPLSLNDNNKAFAHLPLLT